jgi:type VI secretion system secreted protein Hcp
VKVFAAIPSIAGDASAAGYAGQIECQALAYELAIPTDPATGQRLGPRAHKPVAITKAWDRSSPKLADALARGTVLATVTLTCVRETPTFGAVQLILRLNSARVVAIEEAGATGGAALPTEKVSIAFATAEIEFKPEGTPSKVVVS